VVTSPFVFRHAARNKRRRCFARTKKDKPKPREDKPKPREDKKGQTKDGDVTKGAGSGDVIIAAGRR
jgi:hypothetical protein